MTNLRSNATIIVILIVMGNMGAQLILLRSSLNNEVISRNAPSATDAISYSETARAVAAGEPFGLVFRDGRRPPGYPFFLAFFVRFFAQPVLAARVMQIVLSASTILLSFLAIQKITSCPEAGIFVAFLVSVWVPFYYFSPILYAETCGIFVFSVLLYLIACVNLKRYQVGAALCGIAIAALTYLKPNLITLLCLPVAAASMVFPKKRDLGIFVGILALSTATILLPWELFMSARFGQFPAPLSTFQGDNLYWGAAIGISTQANLADTVARKLGLRDPVLDAKARAEAKMLTPVQESKFYEHIAFERWRSHPLPLIAFGLCKILHSFGFSLQGLYQYFTAFFTVFSFAASAFLWRWRKYREWVLVFWMAALVLAAQSFLFKGDIRYKVTVVDLPALFVCALFAFEGAQRLRLVPLEANEQAAFGVCREGIETTKTSTLK